MKHLPMVRWFNPVLLAKLGWQVVVSALFGKYADHRVTQATLDDVSKADHVRRADMTAVPKGKKTPVLVPDEDGAVWIDYVADLGEGFNSTYAIASLLAQAQLQIDGRTLPRGGILIMGGDEVYPTASRDEYAQRTREPYAKAFPNSRSRNAQHPRLYAIPGNHDWYDGLEAFNSIFCRFRDREPFSGGLSIGSWRCKQSRSYFALKLTENCWLWGLDIQLKGYVDQPQVNYFRLMADKLSEDASVILCTAQPSWLKAEKPGDEEYRSLKYIAEIIDRAKGKPKAILLIAGDIHHYSRYTETKSGMQFITAGGGGAFLHPTHQLKPTLDGDWLGDEVTLTLAKDSADDGQTSCFPDKSTSKRLLWGNWKFLAKNWDFCLSLGAIFGILANFLVINDLQSAYEVLSASKSSFFNAARSLFCNVFYATSSVFVALTVWVIMCLYADTPKLALKLGLGTLHALVHLAILIGCTIVFQTLNIEWLGLGADGFISRFALFLETIPVAFVLAGITWSVYLSLTCRFLDLHTNDGFSAMQIEGYKNFLRIRIKDDEITVFPIGLEKVPENADWKENPAWGDGSTEPVLIPANALEPHLIEAPIVIKASDVTPQTGGSAPN